MTTAEASPGDFATKGDLELVRGDVAQVRGDLEQVRGDVAQVRGDLEQVRGDVAQVRGDVEQVRGDLELARRDLKHTGEQLRSEMQHMQERFDTRVEISEERLRGDMHQLEARLIRWIVGTLLTGMGIAAAIALAVARFFA